MNPALFAVLWLFISWIDVNAVAQRQVPLCPEGTQRYDYPNASQPLWVGCKDKNGLFQGLLFQFSNQKEIVRIAHVKNSLRHGKEIRPGAANSQEERHYFEGHLSGRQYIFKTYQILERVLPASLDKKTWDRFSLTDDESLFEPWVGNAPQTILKAQNGRIETLPDTAWNPLALLALSGKDLRLPMALGYGTCKKYSAPPGRFARHREAIEHRHPSTEAKFKTEITAQFTRFFKLCIDEKNTQNLGVLECPAALPSNRPSPPCPMAFSTRLELPFESKKLNFERTLGLAPADFVQHLRDAGLMKFLGDPEQTDARLTLKTGKKLELKRTGDGVFFREYQTGPNAPAKNAWWTWTPVPGHAVF